MMPQVEPSTYTGRRIGESLLLGFDFDANPMPTVKWFKETTEIARQSSKYQSYVTKSTTSSKYRAELLIQVLNSDIFTSGFYSYFYFH